MIIIKEIRDEQGRLHSYNDEPAIITSYGTSCWYHHGELHRENGPAAITDDGDKYWYIHGKEYTFMEWINVVSLNEEHKVELLLSHAYN